MPAPPRRSRARRPKRSTYATFVFIASSTCAIVRSFFSKVLALAPSLKKASTSSAFSLVEKDEHAPWMTASISEDVAVAPRPADGHVAARLADGKRRVAIEADPHLSRRCPRRDAQVDAELERAAAAQRD